MIHEGSTWYFRHFFQLMFIYDLFSPKKLTFGKSQKMFFFKYKYL